ncbi:MAG: hypothetical protein JXX14_19345 [Deltaproteobacteria bacterium]|nr:hypothetical protein [Deltaproteobacteria bacterium]
MNVSREDLFNVDDARALSLHLAGVNTTFELESSAPYVQFKSRVTPTPATAVQSERPVENRTKQSDWEQPAEPFNTWDAMLKWCMDVTSSKSCFVVDPQGFILMRQGEESVDDGFEGAGANVQLALDQLKQMELNSGEVQAMELTYRQQGMLVIRAQDAQSDYYTLCFIGFTAITDGQKKMMLNQIQTSILQLT